jgi:AraC family transcriptional regulator
MGGMSEHAATESNIRLLDLTTKQAYATAGAPDVVHASARRGWSSPLVFEVHRMPAHEYDEHVTIDHQLLVNLGDPVSIGWKEDGRRREGLLPRGALCIQSDGDANAPRWYGTMTFATAAIPPSMVDALLLDRGPRPASTFAKRHCVSDGLGRRFATSLATELASPTEPLYAEVLSQAFVLHLLGTHGQAPGRKQLAPKGRLSAAQLRATLELIHEELGSSLSLQRMASCAGYSPFHFARLFKRTTGFAPHAFVLRLRLERARRMLRQGRPAMDVALATGFYDQPHFARVFRGVFGVTPRAFAAASQ